MRRNTIHNRGRRLMATIVAAAMFAVGIPAGAQESGPLDRVNIHVGDGGERYVKRAEEQIVKLWELVQDHAQTVGVDQLPTFDLYLYGSHEEAVAGSGMSELATYNGYAVGGRAYVAMGEVDNEPVVAHETLHIIQQPLAGGNANYCLDEGAAEWYEMAVGLKAGTLVGKAKQRAAKLRGDYGTLYIDGISVDDITLNDVITHQGFNKVVGSDPGGLYDLCAVAFWMLVETGGGEEAYWKYLKDSRQHGWKGAFERNFPYSWDDYVARFERFRDSGYVEMFTEEEKAERARAEAAEAARQIRIHLIKAILAGVCDPTARPCPE